MQNFSELNLPHLPLEDRAFGEDPWTYFTEARKSHPWLASSKFGVVIHELQAIRDLLSQDDKFRPAYDGIVEQLRARGTPWGRFTGEQLMMLPNHTHKLLRTTFAAKFTPKFANQLRPIMQANINRLLDEWLPKGTFDFEEFASHYPISVMFTMVGAPVSEVPGIRTALETLGLALAMDTTKVPAINDAYLRLEGLVTRLITERRALPRREMPLDLLDVLIGTEQSGSVSERQLVDLVIFLFIAGYDTSKNVLTYTMWTLLQHPEIYARCGKDLDYCRLVLEEAFRWYNPGSIPRFTSQDVVYRDVYFPKETMVLFAVNIAGRDPSAFEYADHFNPERLIDPNLRHAAFGLGKHMCLGQYIARAQLQEALHVVAKRIPRPKLAGKYGWRPFPGIWGLDGLPIDAGAPILN
jgi:cytochrome P450